MDAMQRKHKIFIIKQIIGDGTEFFFVVFLFLREKDDFLTRS